MITGNYDTRAAQRPTKKSQKQIQVWLHVPEASQGNLRPDRNCDTIHSVEAATIAPQSELFTCLGMPTNGRTSARQLRERTVRATAPERGAREETL